MVKKPKDVHLHFTDEQELRYGENPHQKGAFFKDPHCTDPLAIQNFKQLQGKELSFNNIQDMSAAINAISQLGGEEPACVIIKHTDPCGAAIAQEITVAFDRAWAGDPLAPFGGIVIFNRQVDAIVAELLGNKFIEVLLAPEVTSTALEVFSQKKDMRVLQNPALQNPFLSKESVFRQVRGGILVQEPDLKEVKEDDLLVVTEKELTKEQICDLLFAWKIAKVSRSNAVILAKDRMLIGTGAGQKDRKTCCDICVKIAGDRAGEAVAASDAFFPFRDGPDTLIRAGVVAIIQPGGSIRDKESIDACNEAGVAMVYTSHDPKNKMIRGFRH